MPAEYLIHLVQQAIGSSDLDKKNHVIRILIGLDKSTQLQI